MMSRLFVGCVGFFNSNDGASSTTTLLSPKEGCITVMIGRMAKLVMQCTRTLQHAIQRSIALLGDRSTADVVRLYRHTIDVASAHAMSMVATGGLSESVQCRRDAFELLRRVFLDVAYSCGTDAAVHTVITTNKMGHPSVYQVVDRFFFCSHTIVCHHQHDRSNDSVPSRGSL